MGSSMHILLLTLLLGTAGRAGAQGGRFLPYGPPRGALLDLVVGPAGRLFVGAEESGVYASRDGGRTWVPSGAGMGSQAVRALAVDAASGALYAVGDSRVFTSTDGGESWQTLASDLPFGPPPEGGGDVLALGGDAPPTLYLARGVRLFRGTAGGTAWEEVLDTPSRIRALLVDPNNPLSVFAGPEEAVDYQLNGGRNWATLPVDAGVIALDPRHPGTLYTLGPSGVSKSDDDGRRFRRVGDLPLTGDGDLLVDPADSRVLWAARPDGVWQSRDGGATWQARSAGLRGHPAFTLFADPRHHRLEVDSAGFFSTSSP
jgi:hypothetical protein